jgi:hypothetical protein
MRLTAFIQALLASFVLSACASGPALDVPPRSVSTEILRPRIAYPVNPQVMPVVDTTAQREALRRAPHGAERANGGTFHR